jgi:carboxyl-terminal processing protease
MIWTLSPAAVVAVFVGAIASQADAPAGQGIFRDADLFSTALVKVRNEYVSDVNDREAIQAAIQGMLSSLDPHSGYLDPEAFKELEVQTRGEYTGLGLEVEAKDSYVRVVSPIDGTPAARANIQPGDYLTHINGKSIIGLSLDEAVSQMRGEIGTSITLTVAREGQEPREVTLMREKINQISVKTSIQEDVGVIRISAFSETTGRSLREAVQDVKNKLGGRLRGVVLDMRNNPGGLLDQAVEVADAFLDGGEVVSTRGRKPQSNLSFPASPGDMLENVPIVVLINNGSASASEVVAGALQDRNRALIMGAISFGKGSVQTLYELNGGRDGALRLTTARYYTPAGRSIQGVGIEPDIEVADKRIDRSKLKLLGLSEADLPGALQNESGQRRRGPHVPADEPPENWKVGEDYQLKRAIDYLREGRVQERLMAKAG